MRHYIRQFKVKIRSHLDVHEGAHHLVQFRQICIVCKSRLELIFPGRTDFIAAFLGSKQ